MKWILLAYYSFIFLALTLPWKLAIVIFSSSILSGGICYLLLLEYGLWLPVIPAVLVLFLNGLGLTASMFHRDRQNLKFQLKERQYMIKYMSSTIHNRPIQTLKKILRDANSKELAEDWLVKKLNILNQELRDVSNLIEKQTVIDGNSIHIGKSEVDLQCPLKEILYQVYSNTITLDYPHFKTIKFKINNFEDSIDGTKLTVEQKRSLCRFLEEALINVGKYAEGITSLKVICLKKIIKILLELKIMALV